MNWNLLLILVLSTTITFQFWQQHLIIVVALSTHVARTLPSFFSVLSVGEVERGKSRENDLFPLLEEEKEKRRKKVRERASGRASQEGKAIFTYDFVRGI